ncbi:MAG TPA: lipopolysaccharide kinase InaA family protein [Candidatus Binataceae bacterium]|nr:lipopolysaccharide kinase InaA family protein [Candidatus Binataceae bacterium]
MILSQHLGTEFTKLRLGRKTAYLHRDVAALAPALICAIDRVLRSGRAGAGNRASGYPLEVAGAPPLFVRRSRRGGLMRLMGDLYIDAVPRVLRELMLTAEARRRGVPAPEPIGAIVETLAPMLHREALITRAISGMTLWEFVQTDDDPQVRGHVLRLARQAIDTMHEQGVLHDDLNLHNLFVSTAGDGFSVVILDFDKSRLYRRALSRGLRRRNLRRLARSAAKLDPTGRYFDEAALAILTGE